MTTRMKLAKLVLAGGSALLFAAGCASNSSAPAAPPRIQQQEAWRGLHLFFCGRDEVAPLKRAIVENYAPRGVNVLILEVNYKFQYRSHPELADPNGMTANEARELATLCREHGIRLIPQFNCFGHQSGVKGGGTLKLLEQYPELDVTPELSVNNEGIYCRSWNPLHPKTNEIVFELFDELIDAFEADAFHVGMDEVFLFPEAGDPYYEGQSNAEIFAKAVNDYYAHLVEKKGLTMLMWGDRLLPIAEMPHNEYESSANGTAPAADMIPKDIIVCDWHYARRAEYPSVPYLLEKGFRVWPSTWRSYSAAIALLSYSESLQDQRMLGMLCTTWCGAGAFSEAALADDPSQLEPGIRTILRSYNTVADIWSGGPMPEREGGIVRQR